MQRAKIVAGPESIPESGMQRIRELEDAHPDVPPVTAGGLAVLIEEDGETDRPHGASKID